MSVMFITHDFGVVAQIADRVVVMEKGSIVEQGNAFDVLNNPTHPYTQRLTAAVPRMRDKDRVGEAETPVVNWSSAGLAPSVVTPLTVTMPALAANVPLIVSDWAIVIAWLPVSVRVEDDDGPTVRFAAVEGVRPPMVAVPSTRRSPDPVGTRCPEMRLERGSDRSDSPTCIFVTGWLMPTDGSSISSGWLD